jgi:hypothetical protein
LIQAWPCGPASSTKPPSIRSIVEICSPLRFSQTCGMRRPGVADGGYCVTGSSTDGGALPSGTTAAES